VEKFGVSQKQAELLRRKALRIYRRDFLLGYASAIHARLADTRQRMQTTATEAAAQLILRDEKAIREYVARTWELHTHNQRTPKVLIHGAAEAGFRAGSDIALSARPALGPQTT
jgi:hypothetical protein